MKHYRLKEKAAPYFSEDIACRVMSFESWRDINVHENALELLEDVVIEYGQETRDGETMYTSFDETNGGNLHFNLIFPSIKANEMHGMIEGNQLRSLFDQLQSTANRWMHEIVSRNQLAEA